MAEVILENITKTYNRGTVLAADNVSFAVEKGELFGLIGADGAGKTSIFRVLTTLLLPDSSHASVQGNNITTDYKKIRHSVGYMPGKFSLYQDLTVEENLRFFATLFNTTVDANYDLIKDIYVQIEPFKTRRAGKLSGGMKQKLALCCALIHRPQVLFLDEPTTGVDTVSRMEFWQMLQKLRQEGITILVSTPYMDEAALCERIALMQRGKILIVDTPEHITAQYPHKLYAARANNMSKLLTDLRGYENIASCFAFGEFHHISFRQPLQDNEVLLKNYLQAKHYDHVEVKQIKPTVEDCFINLMQA